ncbi:MAG: CGNR zinc finger domain-containing protein [Rhizobiaceae bacterium]|nr:CGNR zinc finger domain-containing protein [Rhizobiaceae bacterium]
MAVSWTAHRFAGGVLALDLANTVVLRGDAVRGFDRFADLAELPRFAAAASHHRSAELRGRTLAVANAERAAPAVIAVRETADAAFRHAANEGRLRCGALGQLLEACAAAMAGGEALELAAELRLVPGEAAVALETAAAVSALSLLRPAMIERLRVCANCRWLFLDSSRNKSRIWCDMAVCGNRHKARRHYRRSREVDHAPQD